MKKTIIENVKIILENKILEDHYLLVDGSKIAGIYSNDLPKDKNAEVIDGKGNYLSPGFIDIHNHGNNGKDVMDGTLEALAVMAEFHAKNGVTGFAGTTMTGSYENTIRAIKNGVEYSKTSVGKENKSQFLGFYLEGPFFSMKKKGAQPGEFIKDPDINDLEDYIKAGKGLIKVVSMAPELPGSVETVQYLKKKNITVSAGHTNATYDEALPYINNGATLATHTYNGMPGFHHREPGVLGAVLFDERVYCEMICDGIHLHKAAMELVYKMKGKGRVVLISDAMRATGLVDGEYDLGGQNVTVKGNEARLADGALAGSTLILPRAVKVMHNTVGVSLYEAVRMASLNPAEILNMQNEIGSIAIGKKADLIIFDNEINVLRVFISGKEI